MAPCSRPRAASIWPPPSKMLYQRTSDSESWAASRSVSRLRHGFSGHPAGEERKRHVGERLDGAGHLDAVPPDRLCLAVPAAEAEQVVPGAGRREAVDQADVGGQPRDFVETAGEPGR